MELFWIVLGQTTVSYSTFLIQMRLFSYVQIFESLKITTSCIAIFSNEKQEYAVFTKNTFLSGLFQSKPG